MTESGSLTRRLAVRTSVATGAIWLLAILSTAMVLRFEQQELLDLQLRETADLFLPVLAKRWEDRPTETQLSTPMIEEPDEALVYLLIDSAGKVLVQSASAAYAILPEMPPQRGYVETDSHFLYVTRPNVDGYSVIYGDPKQERNEAFRDSLLAFLLPMLSLLPIAYFLVDWTVRTALQPLNYVRDEIAARDKGRLDPIDSGGQPKELQAISATVNGLLMRLGQALEAERAFATNAAHELRTPIAVALAQVQRLKADVRSADIDRIDRLESALNRLSRLVQRLLQLARAEAGIGAAETQQDLRSLLQHVLDDTLKRPAMANRLAVSLPERSVPSPIDPDAFGILAGNLIDNALQHSPADSTVTVELGPEGVLRVSNDSPIVDKAELALLTQRFHRKETRGEGFGLGLYIAEAIARHSGGTLTLRSPATGRENGFEAVFRAPNTSRIA